MRPALLDLLCCPRCSGSLELQTHETAGPHVMEGSLRCSSCDSPYPIRRGVPRLALDAEGRGMPETAAAFGYSWSRFKHYHPLHRQQFLDWIAPLGPADMAGKVVLDAGCGKGRHLQAAQSFGASALVGVDLSSAVEVAFAETSSFDNVHVVQANLYRLPFRPRTFDCAWSIGVLHHMPDPGAGHAAVFDTIKVGGQFAAWVYGRENNEWIIKWVNPVRQHILTRLPHALTLALSAMLTVPLYSLLKLVYAPLNALSSSLAGRWLPYNPYCAYISSFPYREIYNIVFDQLVAPTSHYLSQEEVAPWVQRADATQVQLVQHNGNSWRVYAVRAA